MYGSLINRLQERMVVGAPTLAVGMGVTMLSHTDRYPGTIIKVEKSGKGLIVTVQADDAKRIDDNGLSESQEYEYTPNPKGVIYFYKQKEPNTCWTHVYKSAETGRYRQSVGGLFIGKREKYYDFSF